MNTQKYSVNQHLIETILSWVKSGEIAIPEIQRPFVWKSSKVRDLMDSLYNGYPIGYLIAWRNPKVRLKDGSLSEGKKILIDGQQRVTALRAAILGKEVVDESYRRIKIKIAFNPLEEKFEVYNPAIEKDSEWLPDISPIITGEKRLTRVIRNYLEKNPEADEDKVEDRLEHLKQITKKQIGLIELASDLDIETVTEVFIRINSMGVVLGQADFVMSKLAANEIYGGVILRKCIDYFCHLAIKPEFYSDLVQVDEEFTKTKFFPKIEWLKNEKEDLYDPDYNSLLRVIFITEFNRGKLSDLVSLLSGRNFETRTYEEEIARNAFETLENGLLKFINETNFKRFIMIIKSAGFISPKLIRSSNTLNFAYALYLKLKSHNYNPSEIETYVRRWFVLTILTGRYSGSSESKFDQDIKQISDKNFKEFLTSFEERELSPTFWNVALVQNLNTSSSTSPYFNVYLAAQVKGNDKGFLSRDITVRDLITQRGDIHHLFPGAYLRKHGLKRSRYNQIANYVYMQSEINIKVGKKAPKQYFSELLEQCNSGKLLYGGINDFQFLEENLHMNCIPDRISEMDIDDYEKFLEERRILMAKKIKDYYYSL